MHAVSAMNSRSSAVDRSLPVTQPRAARRHDDHDGEREGAPQRSEESRRRNPLVAAMMQAIGNLMNSAAPGAPAASSPSIAPAASTDTPDGSASAPRPDLKEAALAFAHELFDALRSAGPGRRDGDSEGHGPRGHACGYHRHAGHGHAYGNLAQRLERLAGDVAPAAAAATAPAAPAAGLSLTASLTTASLTSTSAGADGTNSTSLKLTTVSLSLVQPAAPAAAAAESPLLAAFRRLFDALQPAAPAGAAKPDAAAGLSSFLQQLAQSLRSGRDEATTPEATQGSLISVAA